jgi:hypothetical protein
MNNASNHAAHFKTAQQTAANVTICQSAEQPTIISYNNHDLK